MKCARTVVRRARARAEGGFTLIEVLVALAIVAVGMAAVMGALTSSAETASYLRDKTFAQWVALNQIANVRLSAQQPAVGNSDGDSDFGDRTWRWHQEVVTTQVPGVVRLDVSVRPADSKAGDANWLTTVSGISGDAVGTPNGFQPDWGTQTAGPGAGLPGNTSGSNPPGRPAAPPGNPHAPVTTPNPPPTPQGTL